MTETWMDEAEAVVRRLAHYEFAHPKDAPCLDKALAAAREVIPERTPQSVIARALADVSALPKWMRGPALGHDLSPLADLALTALADAGFTIDAPSVP